MRKIIFNSFSFFLALIVFMVLHGCEDPYPNPSANFSFAIKTNGLVVFTNSSTNATEYEWTFGNSSNYYANTSYDENPQYVYTTNGTYQVTLKSKGPGGISTRSASVTVNNVISPVASFTFVLGTDGLVIFVNSSKNATEFEWDFGDGTTSAYQNPQHTYTSNQTFRVTLTAKGYGQKSEQFANVTITNALTLITFVNKTFTAISITAGSETKSISYGGSISFSGRPGGFIAYSAYANGTTSSGTQVGKRITWSGTKTFTASTQTIDLNLSSNFFYLQITNNSGKALNNLYVNYGLQSQSLDNISIPSSAATYNIGYYEAYTNGNVRLYQSGTSSYYYWNQGQHYTLPFTENQKVVLTVQ